MSARCVECFLGSVRPFGGNVAAPIRNCVWGLFSGEDIYVEGLLQKKKMCAGRIFFFFKNFEQLFNNIRLDTSQRWPMFS